MTMEEFNEGFGMLLDYYPNTRVTDGLVNIYYMGLAELSVSEFNRAIGKIVKEHDGDFLPKVSTILKYANSDIDLKNQLILAKKMLKKAIEKVGRTGMIAFEDKGLHAVIDFMGWNRLCMMSVEEFDNFINFQFDGIYKGFLENAYETSDYFTGTNKLFGQTEPRMMTYESIGVRNTGNMNFIPLDYKPVKRLAEVENIKKKMLIGV